MENVKLVGTIDELPVAKGFIKNATKKIVFGPDRFWDDYVMRMWTLEPLAGEKDQHRHKWCHWAFCHKGEGKFVIDDVEYDLKPGVWVHVPENIFHRFYNTSETEELMLICIVPKRGDVDPTTMMGC